MTRWAIVPMLTAVGGIFSACAGPASERTPQGKPTAGGGETLVFPEAEALSASREASAPIAAPQRQSVALRAYAASPIGPLDAQGRDEFRVYAALENAGEGPVSFAPSWLRTAVLREGAALEDCASSPVAVQEQDAVAADGALFVALPLSCALRPGEYEVEVSLTLGGDPSAGAHRSVRVPLRIDGALPAYRTGWVVPEEP